MNKLSKKNYIPVNRKALIGTIIFVSIYFLLSFNVELIVNYFLSYNPLLKNIDITQAENQEELKFVIISILSVFPPMIIFTIVAWISLLAIREKIFPPKNIGLPFGMVIRVGREAFIIGCLGLLVSAVQLSSSIYRIFSNIVLVGWL